MNQESSKLDVSVVVPVYNSSGSLAALVARLEETLTATGKLFEVIFVNDGSSDNSWEVLTDLARTRPWAVLLNLMRNYGQHSALYVGINRSIGSVVVTIDDDLQNPPSEIPKLLQALASGVDVVYGAREREQHGLLRNCASRFTKLLMKYCLQVRLAPEITSFRAFRGELRQNFHSLENRPVFVDSLLAGATQRFASVPVRHEAREIGVSNYTVGKLLKHGIEIVTAFSILPLQLASLLGFVFVGFGGLLLAYILISFFLGLVQVPGFTFLAAVICLFSGCQMIVLGIFGTYLAKVYQNLSLGGRICIREVRGRR